jgi:moderate conductance mechanosensitive channel
MRSVGLLPLILPLLLLPPPAGAQEKSPSSVQEFVRLLDDPDVRIWLQQAKTGAKAPATPVETVTTKSMSSRLVKVRDHLQAIAAALPRLPNEARRSSDLLMREVSERGAFGILLLVVAFVALGYGSERLFWRATARTRAWIGAHPMGTVVDRLRMLGMRLGLGLATVAIFGIGSIGAFLIFEWPMLLREIVLTYLLAVLIWRFTLFLGRVVLVPGGDELDDPERYRVAPISTERARFWQRRLGTFVGYFVFGWATVYLLGVLGFPLELRQAAAYLLGLGLLAIGLEVVWRRPFHPVTAAEDEGRRGRTALSVILSACGVLLWLLWVAGLSGVFWLVVVALLLPTVIHIVQTAVSHLLRPTGEAQAPGERSVFEVILERGLRALLIVLAALWLAWAWQIDLVGMTDRDTLLTRLLRGALTSVVVLLIADFLWQVTKAAINRRLAETDVPAEPGTELAVHQARLRTLLPIFRNIFMVVIAVLAGLMALSALGVEIGPLIAGAGVLGVAVGFGAQTVVKDIISGIFFLLDDAFRVGEYIQSGSYKGTVESFSLRSIKLRHHRGPVFTVPFGDLGAVQNMSRDWVIDKFMIAVTYDTNLEKARKLIKNIGQDLAADPELGKQVIEPLKMQGVEQFGDYGIQIRMKMTTKPGEQFVIRRKALARIKQAFDENGIRFALPSVQVGGSEEGTAPAAAQQVVERLRPIPPPGT